MTTVLRDVQELTASAFAGNPETLSQFCKHQAPAAPKRGFSRAVLVLDSPLVQGKTQVHHTAFTGVSNTPSLKRHLHASFSLLAFSRSCTAVAAPSIFCKVL